MERLLIRRSAASARAPRSAWSRASFLPPTPRYGPMRAGRVSRVRPIVDWLGSDFDGVNRVRREPCHGQLPLAARRSAAIRRHHQQGHCRPAATASLPNARVIYVSATGATTVHNLAYAQRLGLWGGEDFPFATRAEFVAGNRGWRSCRHGGAGPRSQGARPLCRSLAVLRGRRNTSCSNM